MTPFATPSYEVRVYVGVVGLCWVALSRVGAGRAVGEHVAETAIQLRPARARCKRLAWQCSGDDLEPDAEMFGADHDQPAGADAHRMAIRWSGPCSRPPRTPEATPGPSWPAPPAARRRQESGRRWAKPLRFAAEIPSLQRILLADPSLEMLPLSTWVSGRAAITEPGLCGIARIVVFLEPTVFELFDLPMTQ